MLKIGAAYVRVSDERQDEYSPTSQLKKVREFASKEGYMIPDEYVFYDDGISGKSVKKRDEFNRMIATAKEKDRPFDKIYVWKFSRFARNQEEAIVYKSLLSKHGVSVVSVSEPIPEGHFGSLIERIIEWTDSYYLVNLATEVKRGMAEKVSRGEPVCAPPFGYVMRDKQYYPDEEKADIVRLVFNLYANGTKQREIAIMLGDMGIRTKFGKFPDNRFVDYMLHNPCYIGKIRLSTDGSRAVSKRNLDNDSIITVDGHHEPLISMELWEQVQALLESQKKAYGRYSRPAQPTDYMLKGLVRCSSCGGTLAVNGISGKAKIRCLQCCNYARGACHTAHGILLPKLEETFVDGLKKAVGSKEFTIAPIINKKQNAPQIDYNKLIAVEERKLERVKEAYLAEIDTIEQYAQNKKLINDRINELIAERDKTATVTIDADAFAQKVESIVSFIEQENVSPAAKNEVLRTVISKVVYDKPNNNWAIYFHEI